MKKPSIKRNKNIRKLEKPNIKIKSRKLKNEMLIERYLVFKHKRRRLKLVKITKTSRDKSLKKGHRDRVRKEVYLNGIHNMSDRKVLEYMLFYAYPYVDTTKIANDLLLKYGSLNEIISQSPRDLVTYGKLTENVAIFLNLFSAVPSREIRNKLNNIYVNDSEKAMLICKNLLELKEKECVYVVCLNEKQKYVGSEEISKGSLTQVQISYRNIIEAVTRYRTRYVILTHNHPSGDVKPSKEDVLQTQKLKDALQPFEIGLIDHIIVSKNGCLSMMEEGYIGE